MIDHIKSSLKVEEDHMCDPIGLQKSVEDSSINTSRVMAIEAYLGRLYPYLTPRVEAVEEQTFEDFVEHSD